MLVVVGKIDVFAFESFQVAVEAQDAEFEPFHDLGVAIDSVRRLRMLLLLLLRKLVPSCIRQSELIERRVIVIDVVVELLTIVLCVGSCPTTRIDTTTIWGEHTSRSLRVWWNLLRLRTTAAIVGVWCVQASTNIRTLLLVESTDRPMHTLIVIVGTVPSQVKVFNGCLVFAIGALESQKSDRVSLKVDQLIQIGV